MLAVWRDCKRSVERGAVCQPTSLMWCGVQSTCAIGSLNSSTDECIAIQGEQTSWKKRYEQRMALEANWRKGVAEWKSLDMPNLQSVEMNRDWIVAQLRDSYSVIVFSASDLKEKHRWELPARASAIALDGDRFAIALVSSAYEIKKIGSGEQLQRWTSLTVPADALAFKGNTMVSLGDLREDVRIRTVDAGSEIRRRFDGIIMSFIVDWDRKLIVLERSTDAHPSIAVLDLTDGSTLRSCSITEPKGIWFTPGTKEIVTIGKGNVVYHFDPASSEIKPVRSYKSRGEILALRWPIAFMSKVDAVYSSDVLSQEWLGIPGIKPRQRYDFFAWRGHAASFRRLALIRGIVDRTIGMKQETIQLIVIDYGASLLEE